MQMPELKITTDRNGLLRIVRDYSVSCPISTPRRGYWREETFNGTVTRWWVDEAAIQATTLNS